MEEVVATYRAAVAATPDDHPERAARLFKLGVVLWARFQHSGASPVLDEAVTSFRAAVAATPDHHAERAGYLDTLGFAVRNRFDRSGAQADLDEAINSFRAAVAATLDDHPQRAARLSKLGAALQLRFRRDGAQAVLDEAINSFRAAVAATLDDHPQRAAHLSILGAALWGRFQHSGALPARDEAINSFRAAVAATPDRHAERAGYLDTLGIALRNRFERSGAIEDLNEAINTYRAAAEATPDHHPERAARLFNLGVVLWARFQHSGALPVLDEAVTTFRAAVATTPEDHPERAARLSNLGTGLQVRFRRAGAQRNLDEAINTYRAAVEATPEDHPERAARLSILGAALQLRFDRTGAQADVDEAINAHRAAVEATPEDHPERAARLSTLGFALGNRFDRAGAQADLDKMVNTYRAAVEATPEDHPERAARLSTLGFALGNRTDRTDRAGAQRNLDKMITTYKAAVAATPDDHPLSAMYLAMLGNALQARFVVGRAQSDGDEAVTTIRAAVEAVPDDHPARVICLSALGAALRDRFDRTGAQRDLDDAVTAYRTAVQVRSAAPSDRLRAAQAAATLVARADTPAAADLLDAAVRLLPEAASRRLGRGDQQHALRKFSGLASDAAALALAAAVDQEDGRAAGRALGLLELGRGVMLSQTLDTRSELTDLHARDSELAKRFIELRDQLDQNDDPDPLAVAGWAKRQLPDRHQLAAAFEDTVAKIRRMEDFETFLLPPEPDQLVDHARNGPVVVINVSRYRSDAILLTPGGVTSLALSGLTWDALADTIDTFHWALETAHDRDASSNERASAQSNLNAVLEWLWDTAAGPVLHKLGYRHTPALDTEWPRVWWVTAGLMGLLPIHAAGYHNEPTGAVSHPTVLDRVVSSYTPTVRALGYARERADAPAAAQRSLVVAMPTTPDATPLPYVDAEAAAVRRRLPGCTLLVEGADTPTPTRANVLAELRECAIAHFACHGTSDPDDPSRSRLLLHDQRTAPLTVASLTSIRLGQARLAYLSACQTALNRDMDLADEVIHLVTAFQLAGYPHVVGTLWEISDFVAAQVADTFYATLQTGDHTIDTTHAARGLHHAVRIMRDKLLDTPSLWAAYLHAGA